MSSTSNAFPKLLASAVFTARSRSGRSTATTRATRSNSPVCRKTSEVFASSWTQVASFSFIPIIHFPLLTLSALFPVQPLDASALKESGELAASASRLFEHLRAIHEGNLRRYFDSMAVRARALGDQGFNSLFRFSTDAEPSNTVNKLIAAYIESMEDILGGPSKDPKSLSDLANEDEELPGEEDAKGSDADNAGGSLPIQTA